MSFSRHHCSHAPPIRPNHASLFLFTQQQESFMFPANQRRSGRRGNKPLAGKWRKRTSVFAAKLFRRLALCPIRRVHLSDSGRFWLTMSGFDDPGVYYSDSFGGGEGPGGDEGGQKRIHIKKRFREFLRQFRVGTDRTGFTYKYRWGDNDEYLYENCESL